MKEFNLERVLAGDPVITRDGIKVTQIHYEKNHNEHNPIVAFVEGLGWHLYSIYGKGAVYNYDLFMAPVKKEGWTNLYMDTTNGKVYSDCRIFPSEDDAKQGQKVGVAYLAIAKVEWKE